jgi:uncharacterized membrane protein YqaE (UPF0057 family)
MRNTPPPLAVLVLTSVLVWIKVGLCTADSLINIALCCLGYLPGLIHAWYIIARNPERDYDEYAPVDGGERGDRVTHYYISHRQSNNSNRQYGTQGALPHVPRKPAQQPPQPPSSGAGPAAGESSEGAAPPPSYSDVVKGDNKVQTAD